VNEAELSLPAGKTSFTPEELYHFTKVKPFVLRFWESEFPSLAPKKTGSERVTYSRADVEMILAIKQLLYKEGLTLAEASGRLSGDEGQETKQKKVRTANAQKKKKKKAAGVSAAVSPMPGIARGKRGLPGTETARTAVSFEDLLPDRIGGKSALEPDRAPSLAATARKPAAGPGGVKKGSISDQPNLRKRLSATLAQLREILTFLDKGDR